MPRTRRLEFSPQLARLAWARKRAKGSRSAAVIDALVDRGSVAVDIGASLGLYTCRLAELVGSSGTVHAFEPNPFHTGGLRALERALPQIKVHSTALSDREGMAELRVPVYRGACLDALGSLNPRSAEHEGLSFDTEVVPVTTLDAALGAGQRVDFIKCDVEGHELAVVRGAAEILRRSRPILVIEIEQRHSSIDIELTFEHLLGLGYEGWALTRPRIRPLTEFDVERDQLSHLGSDFEPIGPAARGYVNNFLFASREADIEGLLAATAGT
jgi:FkbM family methyltransferase